MTERRRPSIADLMADHDLITAALTRAAQEAVREHARAGRPVPTCREGKVVWLSPAEVLTLLSDTEKKEQAGD